MRNQYRQVTGEIELLVSEGRAEIADVIDVMLGFGVICVEFDVDGDPGDDTITFSAGTALAPVDIASGARLELEAEGDSGTDKLTINYTGDLDGKLEVEGELLTRAASPALWARVDGLCRKLGTRPCDNIIGGIDDNFFVTEHPVQLGDRVLRGRTLFVSLSLLKRLAKPEADAILAHEAAHFSGGDTEYSKKTSPMLARFQNYLQALHEGGLSRPVFSFMLLYWSLLQLGLSRSSREREFRADKLAAEATSPASMANALCKVAAYSSYRGRVEASLP